MSYAVCQFIYFKVKPTVRPEDSTNEEGEKLLDAFRATKHQSGYQSSAWGRTVEDPSTIVWVILWSDARGSITPLRLEPYLDPSNKTAIAIHTTLQPPVTSTDTLIKNPVTELCILPFPDNLSVQETKKLGMDLINFRTALVEQLPQKAGPQSWATGHVDRPSRLKHEKSPTGYAMLRFLAVGWESVETHMKAKETEQFAKSIEPIREKMLAPIPGLEMKHVKFSSV